MKRIGIGQSGIRPLVALVSSVLWTGLAGAMVPDTNILPDSSHSQIIGLSTTGSDADINSGILQRVVNYEDEKLGAQREVFLDAEKALRSRQLNKYNKLAATLEDYPLYPYLRYQELKSRLIKASSEELAQFFTDFEHLPIASLLRKKLLTQSARLGRWRQFLEFYVPQQQTLLQCHHLYALIRSGQEETAWPQIEKLWLSDKSQPKGCDRVFKQWRAAGKLTPDLAWHRMELALSNGRRSLARYLIRYLPKNEHDLAKLWIKLHRKPLFLTRYKPRLIGSNHAMAPRIFLSVVKRMARKDPQKTAEFWRNADLQDFVKLEDQYDILHSLAISLSRKHLPGAEAWFSIIPDQYLSDVGREWRIRSALRESRWQLALSALDALTPAHRKEDRWRYWQARVLEELGQESTALSQFAALAKNRSYYGFLAADRIGQPYVINDRPHQPTAGELFIVSQRPDVKRAHELFRLGRIVQARREWREITKSMNNDERIDASKLAQLWGWAEQSILTMASTTSLDDMDLRFPLLFQQQVLAHSERESIDPAWTYGVIRRESAFVSDARSSKGAVGLMQLMPATAKRMSRTSKVEYHSSTQLTHADTNLALGTRYLHMMLKRFGGQTVLATAAYNAGEHRIDRWLPSENELDAERWIENIPFRETREYVTSVLAFTVIYADRLGLGDQRLKERMPTIPVRDDLQAQNNI